MEPEQWDVCEEFPEFAISSHGRFEDIDKRRDIPTRLNRQGICMVTLRSLGQQYTRSVALLVLRAFGDPPFSKRFDSVIHLNGDREDCRVFNLMWRPRPFALQYHDMFTREPYRVSVSIPDKDEFYFSLRELCTTYGVVESRAYMSMLNDEPCFPYDWKIERARE